MYQPGSIIPWEPGETILRCMPDGSFIVEKVSDVCIPPKRLYTEDVFEVMGSSFVRHKLDVELRPGILPKGTVEFMTFSLEKKIGHVVIMEREKYIRPFRFAGTGEDSQPKEFVVGYPRMLFKYIVMDGMVSSLSVAALKSGLIKDDTPLYLYPYTNVYLGGNVCLGSYTYPRIEGLRNLSSYPDVFYDMENTGNPYLYESVISIRDMVLSNENREFNDDMLIPSNLTYSDFVDRELKSCRIG